MVQEKIAKPGDGDSQTSKPVSLHPLDLEQALEAILQVKAPKEARSQKNRSKVKSAKKARRRKKPKSG